MKTKLKDQRLAFIDTETSGLDPTVHEILEFAVQFEGASPVHFKIRPRRIDKAEPKALEVNGYKPENWLDALEPEVAAQQIAEWLKDCVIVGHNVGFDMSFIKAFLKEMNVEAKIGYHLIDTVTLAYEHLVPCGLESLSLKNVCLFLGIPPEPDVHEAANGALKVQAVYSNLVRATWWDRLGWKILK
jgi:DNA polymerase-3 subunit epsilon